MKRNAWILPVLSILLAALILLALRFATAAATERSRKEEQEMVMSYLLMDGAPFTEEAYSGEDTSIRAVYRGSSGYVVEVAVDGYADTIVLWVGVKDDGYVTGITVRDMAETHGLGREALFDYEYLLQYLRSEGDAAVGEDIDALTGATVSSKAITRGVNSAVGFVTGADVSTGATEWGG